LEQHKMKIYYFSEMSLFFNIITQHPEALVSSWHCGILWNCYSDSHSITHITIFIMVLKFCS